MGRLPQGGPNEEKPEPISLSARVLPEDGTPKVRQNAGLPGSLGEPVDPLGFGFLSQLSNFLTEHSCVVPREAQRFVSSVFSESLQKRRSALIVIQEDVTLRVFDECQYIHAAVHEFSYPEVGIPVADAILRTGRIVK